MSLSQLRIFRPPLSEVVRKISYHMISRLGATVAQTRPNHAPITELSSKNSQILRVDWNWPGAQFLHTWYFCAILSFWDIVTFSLFFSKWIFFFKKMKATDWSLCIHEFFLRFLVFEFFSILYFTLLKKPGGECGGAKSPAKFFFFKFLLSPAKKKSIISQKRKIAQKSHSCKHWVTDQFQSFLQIWLLLKKVESLGRQLYNIS